MNVKLFLEALIKFFSGLLIMALLLFLPAGNFAYINGWLLIVLLFVPMFIAGIIMLIKSPELLKSRLDVKEKESEQRRVVIYSGLMFVLGFIIAGLDYRYSWSSVPSTIVYIFSMVFVLCYVLYAEVLRENAFLSRTIKVGENQKVINTGLYKYVRHPMYTITIFLFLSMPIILGSYISLIIFLIYPFIIIKRLNNEESVLEKNLKGYKEYQQKVKYKLIPYIY